ncbi:MAG: hypothetical protein R2911_30110 [Caldilineaceae bacterium]
MRNALAVRRFFDQYNRTVARPNFGVQFTVIDWENYATAGVGRPQELIEWQTLAKYRGSLALVIGLHEATLLASPTVTMSPARGRISLGHAELSMHGFPKSSGSFAKLRVFDALHRSGQILRSSSGKGSKPSKLAWVTNGTTGGLSAPHYKEFTDLQNFRDALQDDLLLFGSIPRNGRGCKSCRCSNLPPLPLQRNPPLHIIKPFVMTSVVGHVGIDNDCSFRIPLSEMYVRLRVMMDEDTSDADSDYDGRPIDIQAALARYQNLVIVGDPGSGKSTFCALLR